MGVSSTMPSLPRHMPLYCPKEKKKKKKKKINIKLENKNKNC